MVAVRMSVTSDMLRSSAIWQSGSTLISPQEKASRRSFETRFSRKSGTRLTASIKQSRLPAARRRDQLRRLDRSPFGFVPRSLLRWEGQCMGRRGRAPKTPTLLDVLWVRGRLKLQNQERSLPRVLDSNLRVTASPTRVSLGVASCQSEILSLKKAVWRLWLVSKSRTKSSAEDCEQLLRRAASVARLPSSPSHARTVLSRSICGRTDHAATLHSRCSVRAVTSDLNSQHVGIASMRP